MVSISSRVGIRMSKLQPIEPGCENAPYAVEVDDDGTKRLQTFIALRYAVCGHVHPYILGSTTDIDKFEEYVGEPYSNWAPCPECESDPETADNATMHAMVCDVRFARVGEV